MGKCDFAVTDHAYDTPSHLHTHIGSLTHARTTSLETTMYIWQLKVPLRVGHKKSLQKSDIFISVFGRVLPYFAEHTGEDTPPTLNTFFLTERTCTLGQNVISSSRPYCRVAWLAEVKLPALLDLCPNVALPLLLSIKSIIHFTHLKYTRLQHTHVVHTSTHSHVWRLEIKLDSRTHQ